MRKFQITTPNLKEPATVVYDANGILCQWDVSGTGMTAEQVYNFKRLVPVKLDSLEAFCNEHKGVTVIDVEFEVSFDLFWGRYGHKVNRKRCEALWAKMKNAQQVKAYLGIEAYDKMLKNSPYNRAKADPDTYLRQEYWENEWK